MPQVHSHTDMHPRGRNAHKQEILAIFLNNKKVFLCAQQTSIGSLHHCNVATREARCCSFATVIPHCLELENGHFLLFLIAVVIAKLAEPVQCEVMKLCSTEYAHGFHVCLCTCAHPRVPFSCDNRKQYILTHLRLITAKLIVWQRKSLVAGRRIVWHGQKNVENTIICK